MRGLPFFKPKNKPQFAGLNFSDASSSGGGGGGGGSSLPNITLNETPTGRTFLGKPTYIRAYLIDNTNSQDINIDSVIDYVVTIDGTIGGCSVNTFDDTSYNIYTHADVSQSKIYKRIRGFVFDSDVYGYVIIEYTKSTD